MAIKIYTYENPYDIDSEPYWDEIKDCAHFCVSQTMVNGLKETYPDFKGKSNVTTVRKLVNSLYEEWENISTNVRQIMEVDNMINQLVLDTPCLENVKRSLLFNTKSIVACIRMFKELDLQSNKMSIDCLNIDQQYLVELYKLIDNNKASSFSFQRVKSSSLVDKAIEDTIKDNGNEVNISNVNLDRIIIHGIHQFTPAILCAIEDISKYKEVILLFNYQKQYCSIYDTWMNIYSLFDLPINNQSLNQFNPVPLMLYSYQSNVLADYIGHLINGELIEKNKILDNLEVIEFDNTTEFANYVATLYDQAKNVSEHGGNKTSPIKYMEEQLYSASGKVNDILRAYFPEQFGERHFLDYPIGHFFISTTNMWDEESKTVKVENFSDLKECLNSGIINESNAGQLVSTFNMILPYIEKERTLKGIVKKLEQLIKNANKKHEDKEKIGYFSVDIELLRELHRALKDLNSIVETFFNDFGNGGDNFRIFYSKIKKFIISRMGDIDKLDEEMHIVMEKLLSRLEESDIPETGTFNALKQTMSYYLSQDDNMVRGAQWIVRNFDQIDGDILRSSKQDPKKICYHFCCLSDKDIYSDLDERLPWPLDIKFFEYCYLPLELNYQVFLKSKMEYRNFKQYALLYGLEFNRVGCKLSYVRSENNKDNDLFYMFTLLGVKIRKYSSFTTKNYIEKLVIDSQKEDIKGFIANLSEEDKIKWSMCPYRFAQEGIVQGRTMFRDRFLIHTYLKILIINRIKKEFSGKPYSDGDIKNKVQDEYEIIENRFRISDELEKTEIISEVCKSIYSYVKFKNKNSQNINVFPTTSLASNNNMRLAECFLNASLKDYMNLTDEENMLNAIEAKKFYCRHGKHCMYCASKDVCLEHGGKTGGK